MGEGLLTRVVFLQLNSREDEARMTWEESRIRRKRKRLRQEVLKAKDHCRNK